jgi:RHS repeat-associated protein
VALPSSATYDPNSGLPLTSVDPNSQTVTYKSYDPLLRPTEIDYPDGGKMIAGYTYDQTGVFHSMTASTQTNTQTNLDGFGRLNWVAVQNGPDEYYWNNYCYDGNGNVQFAAYRFQTGSIVCTGAGDTYTYDALGRVLKITHADSSKITYSYNERATQVTDENLVSRIVQVDGMGRPTAVCEITGTALQGVSPVNCNLDITGTGFLTTYAYSTDTSKSNALKVAVTQGAQTRTFETDALGRTISVVEPESGTTTYSYAYSTTAGLGLTVTRVRPQANQTGSAQTTTTTQYDSLGRVVSVNYSDGTANRLFDYDNNCCGPQTPTNIKGRLSLTGGGGGATVNASVMSYDAMGRVINMWACGPATCDTGYQSSRPLSFAYDWAGNLTQESDSYSGTITYGRSIAGEVTSITNQTYTNLPENPPDLVSNVVNGPDGPVSYTLGNGLNVFQGYDTLGRLSGRWVCSGPATMGCSGGAQAYGTSATLRGTQVTTQSDSILNQQVTFGYDGFNRLTARTVTSGTVQNYTYAYDRYGNRSQTALETGYNFNPTYSATTNHITSSGYAYDAAGNMTNDTVHSYKYDAEGNIIAVDNGSTAQYAYDVFNHRIHVQTSAGTTEYIYDYAGRRVSSWISPNNQANEGRIYWDGQLVAHRSLEALTYFDHADTLGTQRIRTNYAGWTASSYLSLPWGDGYAATVNNAGGDQDNLHFADLERDAESGTEHAQFRNYASAQGRWLSPDPYTGSYDATNPQSMNRYAYVLNNPMSLLDPSGLVVICNENGCYDCDSDNTACASTGDCVANGTEGCITASNPGNTTTLQPTPSAPSSGGSSNGAPSNGTPWYKNPCVQSAVAKGAASTAIDAVGLLPEGGAVAGAFSLWHGAAGVSNGINILSRVQFGAAIISTASAGSDASQDSALSLAGAQLATGFASIVWHISGGGRMPSLKVFTEEDRKMRLPWWGVLGIILGGLPVLILFDHFGEYNLARPTLTSVIVLTIAIAMRWKLRRHAWFWGTMAVFAALHVPLILFVPWTTRWVPAFLIIPIGMADLYLMLWVLSVVGKFMGEQKTTEKQPRSL